MKLIFCVSGVVTRFAGGGTSGSNDGTGAAAKFKGPSGVCVSASFSPIVYVADSNNNLIRSITTAGDFSTYSQTVSQLDISGIC